MKKSKFLGILILAVLFTGTIGAIASTVWNVEVSSQKFYVNGLQTELEALNINGSNYLKVADVAELFNALTYYEEESNSVHINHSQTESITEHTVLQELPSLVSIIAGNSIVSEHFTSGRIAKTTQKNNIYTYEGTIGEGQFQFGNPFPAEKGDRLTFTLNLLEYTSGEAIEEEELILGIVLGADSPNTSFSFSPQNLNRNNVAFPVYETSNYPISILNYSGKEVKYSFNLTID